MKIEQARVQVVNVRDYTVDVLTENSSTPYIGVPILTPWCSPDHAGGINFLPEVGATCYVCEVNGSYFVMGFIVNAGLVDPEVSAGPNFTGKRDPLEPGDIVLSTADGNQVVVRRGGLVQIGATGLCQRIYVPIGNVVRDYFQRYHALSPLGEIDWGHATIVPNASFKDGSTSVAVRYNIKRTLQEDVSSRPFTLEVRYGVLTAGQEGILTSDDDEQNHLFAHAKTRKGLDLPKSEGTLSLTLYDHGENANKVVYAFQLSRSGDLFMMTDGHVHMEFAKKVYVYAGDDVTVEVADGKKITLRVSGSGELLLGSSSATQKAVLGDILREKLNEFVNKFNLHTHGTGVGPSGPPVGAIQPLVPPGVLSDHVKVAG